jgi:integrase
MPADIALDKYVQTKKARGHQYHYFRVVQPDGTEFRARLPHPFDDGYRAAYRAAHVTCFGNAPLDLNPADDLGFEALIEQHKAHPKYLKLSKSSLTLRNLACDLLLKTFGAFLPADIRPLHMQALYDKLSSHPSTANRRMDDMSAIFAWGRRRGFCDINPCERIERVQTSSGYEPWPAWAIEKLLTQGQPHIVKAAVVAIYTGQRRADCLRQLRPAQIVDGVWTIKQGKTGNLTPVPLHPMVLAIVDLHNEEMRIAGRIDPSIPVLKTSRGTPWATGFGASWARELVRLDLHKVVPRLTFHGFRTTNATLIGNAVAKSEVIFGGIERVKSMLGHLSDRMAEHYARRAIQEHTNAETIMLLPDFGKHIP